MARRSKGRLIPSCPDIGEPYPEDYPDYCDPDYRPDNGLGNRPRVGSGYTERTLIEHCDNRPNLNRRPEQLAEPSLDEGVSHRSRIINRDY